MGRHVFKLPDVGEGVAEAEIVKWHVAVGDTVKEEHPLVDIMTDKATVEIASPVSGRVVTRNGAEGSKLAVGAELAVFETETESKAEPVPSISPPAQAADAPPTPETASTVKALAAPAVRARAKSLGLDLAHIAGTGPNGQVRHSDLDAQLLARQGSQPVATDLALAAPEPGSEDIKIFGIRRRIAERMQESKRRIPHFTYVEEVDMTEAETLRAKLNANSDLPAHLTALAFVIRALINTIRSHPVVNAQFDDANGVVRRFQSVHLGIATQTERGLLVPVIHHAETMDIWRIAAEVARLSELARSGKAAREELAGSTITVTSLGALGGVAATPIINPPEVAVIGVNRIAERPVARDGAIVIAKMMNLSSSFDHRIVDGHTAAAFIKAVKDSLEKPDRLSGNFAPASRQLA
jgi:2-oxoisovalerate dehydrogenase E2 component (dihydrolipoyl transacylase)